MANRFLDTNFFKSPFVRGLKGSLKGLYTFIICDCSGAGIWVKDLKIASEYIGFEISEKDFNIFIEKGKAIDLNNGKFFFPGFIEHQYTKGLQENNPAHKNFILELKKFNLIDSNLKVLTRPFEGSKVKVKVKATVMDKELVTGGDGFEILNCEIFEKAKSDYSKLLKMKAPLSNQQAERLESEFSKEVIIEVMEAMQNKPDLIKKYESANLTIRSWIKIRKSNNGSAKSNSGTKEKIAGVDAESLRTLIEGRCLGEND